MWTVIDSPLGELRLVGGPEGLSAIDFSPFRDDLPGTPDHSDPLLVQAAAELAEYFAGQRSEFTVPLAPHGTEFQLRVWRELQRIDYGMTASYGELASRLGLPVGAARAVGAANGRNPLPIVIPCHRVIGADGSLTGYAGGTERKRILLELESPTLL